MDNSVVLSVGDTFHLRRGKDRIVYAGMPSEKYTLLFRESRNSYHMQPGDMLGICFIQENKAK